MDTFYNNKSLYGNNNNEDDKRNDKLLDGIRTNKEIYSKFLQYLSIQYHNKLVIIFNNFIFQSKKNATCAIKNKVSYNFFLFYFYC